jgi:hypothetical protein
MLGEIQLLVEIVDFCNQRENKTQKKAITRVISIVNMIQPTIKMG